MSETLDERFELEKLAFFEQVKLGITPLHAAVAQGWTPRKLKKLMEDKTFAEDLATHQDLLLDSVEQVVTAQALGGKAEAWKFLLQHKRPQVWADKVEVRGELHVTHEIVEANRESLRSVLLDAQLRKAAVAELGPVIDVETVDDGDA
jgi:hypothetical protein